MDTANPFNPKKSKNHECRMAPVVFGYSFNVERFQRFRFSVGRFLRKKGSKPLRTFKHFSTKGLVTASGKMVLTVPAQFLGNPESGLCWEMLFAKNGA